MPNGGGAFIGFTDIGKSITSVTYEATADVVAIDDIQFGNAGRVPEPAVWALMLVGLGGVGMFMRARRTRAAYSV